MNVNKMARLFGERWPEIEKFTLSNQQYLFCYGLAMDLTTEQSMRVAAFKKSTTAGRLRAQPGIQEVADLMKRILNGDETSRKGVCTKREILRNLSELARTGPPAQKLTASLRLLDYQERKEERESDSESVVRGLFGDMKAEDIRRLVSNLKTLSADELQTVLKSMKAKTDA